MPLDTTMVGANTRTFEHAVDARWLMAYAAGIDDCNPRYMDTAAGTVIGHPVFPVCLEWPVILSSRELPGYETVTPAESARGVHAAHDLHITKPVVAGETYRTTARIVSLEGIRPGAAQTTRLVTVDAAGDVVATTWQLGISRGVEVTGEPVTDLVPPALPDPDQGIAVEEHFEIPVREGAANVYTECARIWNPIHSDRGFALAAGLPDIILHGTATLALGISRLVDEVLGGDSTRVRRLGGRFSGMVLMPTVLTLRILRRGDGYLAFDILNPDGGAAFSMGFVVYE